MYASPEVARVRIRIHKATETYSVRTGVSVSVPVTHDHRGATVTVVSVQTLRPGSRLTNPEWHASIPVQVQAGVNGRDVTARVSTEPDRTEIQVTVPWDNPNPTSVTAMFFVDDAFRAFGGDGAFRTFLLGLKLRVPLSKAVRVDLEHGDDYSLRCRIDNSEYHSLATGVAPSTVQKKNYHPTSQIEIRYLFGTHGDSSFRELARLPLGASFGLIAASLALAFQKSGDSSLAAAALAFALLPPVLQATSRSRVFYRSADIRSQDVSRLIGLVTVSLYIPAITLAIVSMTDAPSLRSPAQVVCYGSSALLGALAVAVLISVREQVVPAHYCDVCARRILWRSRAHLDKGSRRTVCGDCSVRLSGQAR